jgi:hypothetical protein
MIGVCNCLLDAVHVLQPLVISETLDQFDVYGLSSNVPKQPPAL